MFLLLLKFSFSFLSFFFFFFFFLQISDPGLEILCKVSQLGSWGASGWLLALGLPGG